MNEESKNPVLRGEYTGEKNGMYGKGYLISGEKNGMYGKTHREDTKEKMRKPKSEDTKKRMSEARKGKLWINNGKEQKCVTQEEYLTKYPEYQRGRLKDSEHSLTKFTFEDGTTVSGEVLEVRVLREHPGFSVRLNRVRIAGTVVYIKEEIDDIDHNIPARFLSREDIHKLYNEIF